MFDTLEHKFGTLEHKFETLEHKFDSLEHRFLQANRVNASNFLPFNI